MGLIEVNTPDGSYPLQIEKGLLRNAGPRVAEQLEDGCTVALVTNPTVGAFYAGTVTESFVAAGFTVVPLQVPEGEHHKTLETASHLWEQFCRLELERQDAVVALGGGVVGDLGGFAASTYMRGIRFVQIPTTLLAMVDASIGGKTAINLPEGKNLVGVFAQPAAVLNDPDTLSTLPPSQLACGMAEVIKHGLIGSARLFDMLEAGKTDNLDQLIEQAIRVKVAIVQRDPFERSDRALLNLGHTFGHAFEYASGFRMMHGDAVGLGLIAAARLGVSLGECDASLMERIEAVVEKFNLPTRAKALSVDSAMEAMQLDKKKRRKQLRFVIPVEPGYVKIVGGVAEAFVRDAAASVLD